MARVIGIDHLSIRVSDYARSKKFYDTVLGALGFKLKYDFGSTAGWSNGKTLFWIGEADAEGRRYKYRFGDVGFHHYAFELSRRSDVDELYGVLRKHKVTVVDPPKEYPEYGGPYYAVFFLDPDGMKLEGMHFPAARAKPKAKKAAKKAVKKKAARKKR